MTEQGWRIEPSCINCDMARQLAPDLIAERSRLSVLTRQPADAAEELALWQAALACPVAAIRAPRGSIAPAQALPKRIEDGLYLCGYASAETFGANAYLLLRPDGNLLVDAPRWSRAIASSYQDLGGIDQILVTHRDHVPNVVRYAEHFGARIRIHTLDADRLEPSGAQDAIELLHGGEAITVADGVLALPSPGHTAGSVCYLVDGRLCFTGDSLYWSRAAADLEVFETVLWHSRPQLLDSIRRLAGYADVEWVLPGHGDRHKLAAGEFSDRLHELAKRMAERPGRRVDLAAVRW
jgi:glyoxylase-like metal-dependent hydrolase (beta-lactamase superfamily II)